MITKLGILVLAPSLFLSVACGGSQPEPAAPAEGGVPPAGETTVATKPPRDKLVTHLREHVTYPVSREDLLKACADTPEFSASEKKWLEENLPEGTYESADAAIAALKL